MGILRAARCPEIAVDTVDERLNIPLCDRDLVPLRRTTGTVIAIDVCAHDIAANNRVNGIRDEIPADGDLIVCDGLFSRAASDTSVNCGVFHNDLVPLNRSRAVDRTSAEDFTCYRTTREDNFIFLYLPRFLCPCAIEVLDDAACHLKRVVDSIRARGGISAVCRQPLINIES